MYVLDFRVLSVDDSPLVGSKVLCVGVVSNGSNVEGVLTFKIKRDGVDASKKLIERIKNSKFHFSLILIHGVVLGGFNVIDLNSIFLNTGVPVICVFKSGRDREMLKAAEKIFGLKRRKLIEKAGVPKNFGKLRFYHAGLTEGEAKHFLSHLAESGFPWSLRLAHLIGSGVVLGESKGKI